jgi:hypothetical protein
MSFESRDGAAMVSDAELVQYMDGELGHRTAASVVSRIAEAPGAADRLEILHRRSARISVLLDELGPEDAWMEESAAAIRRRLGQPRARWAAWIRTPAFARAAATIAVLLGATVAVPGARAWVVGHIRGAVEAIGLRTAPPPAAPGLSPDLEAEIGVVFAVPGDRFEIRLTHELGTLIVRSHEAGSGSAEAVGAPGTGFSVMPGILRIEGPGSPDAEYRVSLPRAVTSVYVSVGDGPLTRYELPAGPEALRVRLR